MMRLLLGATCGTQPFNHIVDSCHFITLWQLDWWHSKSRKTKGLHATLAIEMDMGIVVVLVVVAVTQFVSHTLATTFQHMHQMMLLEQG